MERTEVHEYVANRAKVAQTYLEHGLLVESRDIFSQISRNLSNIRKRINEPLDEFLPWLEKAQSDVQEKLDFLDREISAKKNPASTTWFANRNDKKENPKTEFLKGIGLKELGFFKDAVESFQKALRIGHQPYECLKELLDVCRQDKDSPYLVQEVKENLEKYSMSLEEKAELWRKLSILYEKLNKNAEALAAMKKAKEFLNDSQSSNEAATQAAPDQSMEIPFEDPMGEEVALSMDNSDEPEIKDGLVPPEEPASLELLTLTSEPEPETHGAHASAPESAEVSALQEEIKQLRSKLARAQELVDEYQKRYTAIMSQSNALQKENRQLKDKLASSK